MTTRREQLRDREERYERGRMSHPRAEFTRKELAAIERAQKEAAYAIPFENRVKLTGIVTGQVFHDSHVGPDGFVAPKCRFHVTTAVCGPKHRMYRTSTEVRAFGDKAAWCRRHVAGDVVLELEGTLRAYKSPGKHDRLYVKFLQARVKGTRANMERAGQKT